MIFINFLFPPDKPSPPSDITVSLGPQILYQYNFKISPPRERYIDVNQLTYSVEVFTYRTTDTYYSKCSCMLNDNIGADGSAAVAFEADEFVGYDMYFRAAIVSGSGTTSDFLPFYSGTTTCGTRVETSESINY